MFLALTTLLARFTPRPRPAAAPAPRPVPVPTLCYEVLVPYLDPRSSRSSGLPEDARHAIVVQVWAPDVKKAVEYARERFRDHRACHPGARIVPEGPVALRVVREHVEAAA